MAFMGGSTKMTQAELDALIRAQQGQLATNAMNQATGVYSQQGQLGNPYYYGHGYGQLNANVQSSQWAIPQGLLEEKEREDIRYQEREACAQLVIDMAEELGCPNLLHGVALAIKARGPK